MKTEYEIGDPCWLHMGKGLTKGTVVHKFTLDDWGFEHYVVEIPTSIDPILEVRDAHTLSEDENGPIGLFRKVRKS